MVVVVTGAGGTGCGRAIARRFAHLGAAIVVSDINETGGHETVRLIQQDGGRAAFQRTDVGDERQARDLIASGEATFGAVTILVNNASAPFRPGEPLDHWADALRTDLIGATFCTRGPKICVYRTVQSCALLCRSLPFSAGNGLGLNS